MRLACDRLAGAHLDLCHIASLQLVTLEAPQALDAALLAHLLPGDAGTAFPTSASQQRAAQLGLEAASLPGRPFRCCSRSCAGLGGLPERCPWQHAGWGGGGLACCGFQSAEFEPQLVHGTRAAGAGRSLVQASHLHLLLVPPVQRAQGESLSQLCPVCVCSLQPRSARQSDVRIPAGPAVTWCQPAGGCSGWQGNKAWRWAWRKLGASCHSCQLPCQLLSGPPSCCACWPAPWMMLLLSSTPGCLSGPETTPVGRMCAEHVRRERGLEAGHCVGAVRPGESMLAWRPS